MNSMSDNAHVRWKEMLGEFRDQIRPLVERVQAAAKENIKQLAADVGEPFCDENALFFGTLGTLAKPNGGYLDSTSSELRAVFDLANMASRQQPDCWQAARQVTRRMFEQLDGGEELGLTTLLRYDFDTPDGRAGGLRHCAKFYRVPPRYAPPVGEVVEAIMVSHPGRDLPQTWSAIYCYVTATIVARRSSDAVETGEDGC
jgi:hypothetical protein